MKKLSFALLALSIFAFAGCGSAYTPAADAQDSPENVVNAFYEAFAVSPDSALQFVSAEAQQDDRFQSTWDEIKNWTFTKAEVVEYSDLYVTVDFEIIIEGETDSGSDEVEVQQIDGKWWIVDLPS